MAVSLRCPACDHQFAAHDSADAGREACPACGYEFETADSSESAASSGAAPPPIPPRPPRASPPEAPPPLPTDESASPPPAPDEAPPKADKPTPPPVGKTNDAERSQHSRSSNKRWMALAAVGAVVLLVIMIALVWWAVSGDAERQAATDSPVPPRGANQVEDEANQPPASSDGLTAEELAELSESVVALDGANSLSPAFGMVVSEEGLIVTLRSSIRNAEELEAETRGGSRIPISGVVAESREHNLALLKLAPQVPMAFEPIEVVAETPEPGGKAYAFNRPPFDVIVDEDSFPPFEECRVEAISTDEEIDWRRGDGAVNDFLVLLTSNENAPEEESGPLLDAQGRLLGLLLSTSSYDGPHGPAISAEHIADLMKTASDEVRPLPAARAEEETANEDDSGDDDANGDDRSAAIPPRENTEFDPGAEAEPPETLAAKIEAAADACAELDWRPTSAEEYEHFQRLARLVTEASRQLDRGALADEERETVPQAIDDVLNRLAEARWPDYQGWKEINGFASRALQRQGEGVYLLGRVKQDASQSSPLAGDPTVVLEMVGSTELVLLLNVRQNEPLAQESQWLVLGVHDPSVYLNFSETGDLGKTIERRAASVRAKYLIQAAPAESPSSDE